jgi:hypothetical protein
MALEANSTAILRIAMLCAAMIGAAEIARTITWRFADFTQ